MAMSNLVESWQMISFVCSLGFMYLGAASSTEELFIFKHLHHLYRQFNRLSSFQLLKHVSVTSANMIAGWNQRTNSPGPRLGCVLTGHNTTGKVAALWPHARWMVSGGPDTHHDHEPYRPSGRSPGSAWPIRQEGPFQTRRSEHVHSALPHGFQAVAEQKAIQQEI